MQNLNLNSFFFFWGISFSNNDKKVLFFKIGFVYCLFLVIAFNLLSCGNNGKLPELKIKDGFKGKIDLKSVQLLGPFLIDSTKTDELNSLDVNDLDCFGLEEDRLSEKDYLDISYESAKNKKLLSRGFKNRVFNVPTDNIDFFNLIDTIGIVRNESSFYLACNINSDKEQKIIFLASTCFGIKVWLNNRLIQKENGKLSYPKGFDYYMVLELKKGNNFFLVKTNRGFNHICWVLASKFADFQTAKEEYGINCFTDFISNPVIQNLENLEIYVGGYLKGKTIKANISDKINRNKIYDSIDAKVDSFGYCQIPVNKLQNDFYNFSYKFLPYTFSEMFYLGDKFDLFNTLDAEIKKLKNTNSQDSASLNGAMGRFEYLLHKEYRIKSRSEIKFNDKNLVLTAFSVRNILENSKNKIRIYENAKETYLKAYKSKIDGQYQYYMFHVSEKVLAQKKIPLVVILPYFHEPLSPMLKSWYLSNTDQIEWEKKLADENEFALLWPYLRGNSSSSSMSTVDFFEAFEDVKRNYIIDSDRVFLMGDCYGAKRVLMLSSRYPDIFAGLSIFQAETKAIDETVNPINFVGNLFNIPIYVYHSVKDDVVPISNSDDFVKEAASYVFKPLYDKSENESHYLLPKNCHTPIFQFFKNKNRNLCPNTIYYTTYEQKYNKAYWIGIDRFSEQGKAEITAKFDKNTNVFKVKTSNISAYSLYPKIFNISMGQSVKVYTDEKLSFNGVVRDSLKINLDQIQLSLNSKNKFIEGPINHFFADKFTYIEPINGASISKIISEKWSNQIFFKMNNLKENDFTEPEFDCNIILFNNQYVNRRICDLISRLPIRYDKSKLIFRNKEVKGTDLSICFIYPNPINANKYVLYFGGNQSGKFKLINQNLIIDGNYDYIIWNETGYEIDKGFFDINWQ